jgi:hypothetical protein
MKLMELESITNRPWSINACSAINGDGVKEGTEWIVEIISKKNA